MNLYEPLWHQLLLQIYKVRPQQRYLSRIHRKLRGSLNHLRVITQRLHDSGVINIVPTKNRKMIELTSKGEKIAVALLTLKSELNDIALCHE